MDPFDGCIGHMLMAKAGNLETKPGHWERFSLPFVSNEDQ